MGSGTIRKHSLAAVGVASLEEVCHWELLFRASEEAQGRLSDSCFLPAARGSRSGILSYLSSTMVSSLSLHL